MATTLSAAALFDAAAAALGRGDFAGARRQSEQLLRTQPDNPSVLQLAGIACAQAGDPKRGASYLKRAIALGDDTPDNRLNLAQALIAAGDLDAAERLCRDAPADEANSFARLRAEILKRQGRQAEAVQLWEDLAAAAPADAAALNNLGNARHAAGDLDGALAALQQARALDPASSLVHLNLARVLLSLDRYEDACLVFEEAHKLAPTDPLPLLELGRTLASLDHAGAALPALGSAARLDRHNPAVFVAIGQTFLALEERAKAEQSFRAALQVAPHDAAAALNLGILLEQGNRLDALAALVAEADRAGARGPGVDYLRALLLRRQDRTDAALALARGIAPDGAGVIDPAVLAHFVAELADRTGDTATAWEAVERMNRAAAQSPLGRSVDRTAYQRDIDRAAAAVTPAWVARWAPAPAPVGEAPVFLVGFPRSGTTLLDTFLLGHSRVHVLEEVPVLQHVADAAGEVARLADLTTDEVAALRARYFAELVRVAPGAAGKVVIDKNPLSMLRLPLIHRLFPEARIILALRHPADAVLSCVMQNFKPTAAMASFLDPDTASRTYDRAFANWEGARALLPAAVHELRYEALVADPAGTIRPLTDFIGLPWEEGLLDHRRSAADRGYIRTPSYAQVTEPVYARAAGRWTRYREPLRWSLPILQPWIERYGYAADGGAEARSQPVTESRGAGANGVT